MKNFVVACALGALLFAGSARADDTLAPPPVVKTHPRTGLVAGGASLFATTYLASVFGAVGADPGSPYEALYAPIVGPFYVAGHTFATTSSSDFAGGLLEDTVGVLFLIDGLAQLGGAAMMIAGFALPRKIEPAVRVSPLVGRGMTGLGLTGAF
ncbi:MAG TPA: hypothetical protein VGH28_19405 [Polyangiaceae bacterium]|jgi:hypothetical protein